ncbi:MAG: copper amine oxidase N-terminal domain-containing protein [Clostridia bacterium]|nr:copper amine oxidase N-terminal domain-containing protein [Clostridia bacterium]
MKKAKVFISLLCAFALMAGSLPSIGLAQESEITVIVDGVTLDPTAGKSQIVGNGTTMVPFRAIFEALGFEVDYFPKTGMVATVIGYNTEMDVLIGMSVGENVVYKCSYSEYLNDNMVLWKSPYSAVSEKVFIDETGRTLILARAVSEAVGAEVLWAADLETVIITYETKNYYSGTDIPRYEYVVGETYISVSTDAYGNPLYVYPYPSSNAAEQYSIYIEALNNAGIITAAYNADEDDRRTVLYESQSNNYLLVRVPFEGEVFYIAPYSNKLFPYYISGLSGTSVQSTRIPNYTYYTGSECLSWTANEDGNHIYQYKYEQESLDNYIELLLDSFLDCYLSSDNSWSFTNEGCFVDVEADAASGYIYITPYVGTELEIGYYYDDGSEYYNTDIPTFCCITGIEPSHIESDNGVVVFTYECSDDEYREYLDEFEEYGFGFDISEEYTLTESWDGIGEHTIMESWRNQYIHIVRNGQYVSIWIDYNPEYYLGTDVLTYTTVTGVECWTVDISENGNYFYSYDPYTDFDFKTYCSYLENMGHEIIHQEQGEGEYKYGTFNQTITDMTNGTYVIEFCLTEYYDKDAVTTGVSFNDLVITVWLAE